MTERMLPINRPERQERGTARESLLFFSRLPYLSPNQSSVFSQKPSEKNGRPLSGCSFLFWIGISHNLAGSMHLTDYAQGYQWGTKGIVNRESVYWDGELSVLQWGNSCIGRQDFPAFRHFRSLGFGLRCCFWFQICFLMAGTFKFVVSSCYTNSPLKPCFFLTAKDTKMAQRSQQTDSTA